MGAFLFVRKSLKNKPEQLLNFLFVFSSFELQKAKEYQFSEKKFCLFCWVTVAEPIAITQSFANVTVVSRTCGGL